MYVCVRVSLCLCEPVDSETPTEASRCSLVRIARCMVDCLVVSSGGHLGTENAVFLHAQIIGYRLEYP